MGKCKICGKENKLISSFLGLCLNCIREKPEKAAPIAEEAHRKSRSKFDLPGGKPPKEKKPKSIQCRFCGNECVIPEGSSGFCGLVENKNGKMIREKELIASFYRDPHPTNCVSAWCCAATGAGYPKYSYTKDVEYDFHNLAVFCIACPFDCLFCQNWQFRRQIKTGPRVTDEQFLREINDKTSCICFFGGDPAVQLDKIVRICRKAEEIRGKRILRYCLETDGNANENILKSFIPLGLESGGTIKIDIKFWNENLNKAITGISNKNILKNFKMIGEFIKERKPNEPPFLTASTLMVPGYVDDAEIKGITEFIASIDENIPYSLLGFFPHFEMGDLPLTTRKDAERYVKIAKNAGLKMGRIGNPHLLV